MNDCLFCRISSKKINTDIVFEDKKILAFRDISPQAPVHILLIPKIHISTLNDLTPKDVEIAGHLIYNAAKLAKSALKNWVRYQEEFYKYYNEILATADVTVKR